MSKKDRQTQRPRNTGERVMRLVLLLGLLHLAPAAALPAYRDLMVYTTSAPDRLRPDSITALTTLINRGRTPLAIEVRMHPCQALGFPGGAYAATLAPGGQARYEWAFPAPTDLRREIVTGEILINGSAERDLYVSVQGPDPVSPCLPPIEPVRTAFGPDLAAFRDAPEDRVTEPARVVATYAPRTLASIQAELASRDRPRARLVLAAGGKTRYTIVPDELPDPLPGALADALDDLRRCIALQSGAEIPVATASKGPAIRLRLADVRNPGLHDAYRLYTKGKDVIVEGENADALAGGIYGLLVDHLGCRWYMPGRLGEEIPVPADKTVRLPLLDETRGSAWVYTSGACNGADRRWDRRNRAVVGSRPLSFGHNGFNLINPAEFPYEKHPDYYARDRQGRIRLNDQSWTFTCLCTTSPDVIKIVAKKTNAYFAAHPEALVASLEPNDYGLMCLCDNCLALDKRFGQTREDGRQVADRLLEFSRQIYDRLDPQYKDRYLGILIYGNQDALPITNRPHPHHAGIICNFMLHYDHSRPWTDPTSPRNVEFYRRVKGWGRMLTLFGYYDYYGHWAFFGPWAMVHKMREDLPAFRELGGTFVNLENQPNFAAQGLNHYISANLLRDLHADVDLLMEDFFTGFYGPAARPMRNYWLTAERYYALERPGIMPDVRVAARPDFWAALDDSLAEATRLTADLPPERQRYADRVRFARDGLDFGRILHEHEARFGQLARRDGVPIDHAAAIAFLQAHRARLDDIMKRYPAGDAYWPPLVAGHFRIVVDSMVAAHRQAMR